jgi:hypothetical protein
MKWPSSWVDVSSTTQAGQLFRFVWLTARGAGTGLLAARVGGFVEIEGRNIAVYAKPDWVGQPIYPSIPWYPPLR